MLILSNFPKFRSYIIASVLSASFNTAVYALTSYEKSWSLFTYTNRQNYLYTMVEPQLRLINNYNIYEQFLLNAGLGKAVNSELEFWLGQTYVNTAAINALEEDVTSQDTNEMRIWEQILWTHPFYFYQFELRSRMEERRSLDFTSWSVRWRNRCFWTVPISTYYSFIMSDEFFLNLKQASWITTNTFDQNRAFIGLSKKINNNININFGYMNQYLAKNSAEDNNVLFINLLFQA